MGQRNKRALQIGFELALATLGWIAIVLGLRGQLASAASTIGALAPLDVVVGAALFLAVSAGSRLFAFPLSGLVRGLPPSTALTLDAAILVAGALSVGAPVIAAGLAVILSSDSAVRAMQARRSGRRETSRGAIVRRALYTGGIAGGLLLVCTAGFGARLHDVDRRMWLVPVFGLAFLTAHSLVQIAHAALLGDPLKPVLRRALVASAAEATLLPIGAVIVNIFDPRHPLAFILLAATYLLVNLGFYRIARITASLRGRVRELHTLTRTAQAMSAELEVPRLATALLRETQRALPAASTIELRLLQAEGAEVASVQRYALELGRQKLRSSTVPRHDWDGVTELTIEQRLDAPIGAPHARMIAPLAMYGEQLGVLVVESRQPAPFGEHEARLVEAVAGQAASALENARLHALANFDGLTGLYCRRYFDARLAEEIERARRFDASFCVLLLDIDNFKRLNDTRGHLAGDRVLREVARLAQAQLRNVDLAARYGGEELVFILPRTTLTDAHVVAERIREAVASHVFSDLGRVTVSIGVAAFSDTSADVHQLVSSVLGRADVALYRAKATGKDRVEVDLGPIELSPSLAPISRRRA